MNELKTALDAIPSHLKGYLLVFAPTLLCLLFVAKDFYMDYKYAEAYVDQHKELDSGQLTIEQTLVQHNLTLLRNHNLLLSLTNVGFALCMNQASTEAQQDRCIDAKKEERRIP